MQTTDDFLSRYDVEAIRELKNRKVLGPDRLAAELLKVLADKGVLDILRKFNHIFVAVCRGGDVPQQ